MANGFGTGFARGFEKTLPTGLQIGATSALAATKERVKKKEELDKAVKLGKTVKDLDIPGADRLGEALESGALTPSEAISLAGVLQKGQPNALELALASSIGLDLSTMPTPDIDKAITDKGTGLAGTRDVRKRDFLLGKTDKAKGEGLELESLTLGGAKFKRKESLEEKVEEKKALSEAEQKVTTRAKMDVAQRNALNNLDLTTGAFTEMAATYSDAVREGGMGSKFNQIKADARLFVGGRQAEDLPNTAAWQGQKTEVIARMMPMLTQQGEKPGSVRLVATVFDKLALTVPSGNTPPKNARTMLEKSIRNMYRFARAAARLGVTNDTVEGLSATARESLSDRIASLANTIELKGEEKAQVINLIDNVLSPIDTLIDERGDEGPSTSGFHTGDETRVDGILYKRGKDGKWLPKKNS